MMTKTSMTQDELDQAAARMDEEEKRLELGYKLLVERDEAPDGWNSPPALIPRPGELAMGFYYDPNWNTR
jgi:hypothetical protein